MTVESIEGQIVGTPRFHRVSPWSEGGNKYLIANFQYDGKLTTIKGELNNIIYGWTYRLYGSFGTDDYGSHFAFHSFEPLVSKSNEGMADYLLRSVPEIGKARSRAIVDHFGNDTFIILKQDPSQVENIDGMPRHAIEAIKIFFSEDNSSEVDPEAYARLYDILSHIRPPRRVILSLLKLFGSNAPQFVTENPYRLLDYPGMGWTRVDKLAIEVLSYNPDGVHRHEQAIKEILSRHAENGHTKIDYPTLHCDSSNLLGRPLSKIAFESFQTKKQIVFQDKHVSLEKLFRAETQIAFHINRLRSNLKPLGFSLSEEGFEDEQKAIPKMIEHNALSIITGVPGSGKSHSLAEIVKQLVSHGITNIIVMAPTGKAAKRDSEFLQVAVPDAEIPSMTIHRALGGRLDSSADEGISEEQARINRGRERFVFGFDKNNHLPFSIFIIDEASMVDVELGAAALQAMPDDARLIIVGDHHQLPSVGPGSFLRDLLKAGIPHVILDRPRRNSGAIAEACYLIKEGKNPDPKKMKEEDPQSNWSHIEIAGEDKIIECIKKIHLDYISKFGFDAAKTDLQVISPEKRGTLGCHNLNALLGAIVNPGEAVSQAKLEQNESSQLRAGDKVVRTKNGTTKQLIKATEYDFDYFSEEDVKTVHFNDEEYAIDEAYVVNGDMGEVIGFKDQYIIVKFINPDRLCMLSRSDARVSLAYAMTVHKCQGSGFPIVILPLSSFYWNPKTSSGIWCRELVYTGGSRPIQRWITIGPIAKLYEAIGRVTVHQRQTRLEQMLRCQA
jgi:exodeoxyribonuclease V alpha subunit